MNETWQDIDSKNPSTSVKRSLNKLGANLGTEIPAELNWETEDKQVLLQRIERALTELQHQPELAKQLQNLKEEVQTEQVVPAEAHEKFFNLVAQAGTQTVSEQSPPKPFVTRFFNALRHTFSR